MRQRLTAVPGRDWEEGGAVSRTARSRMFVGEDLPPGRHWRCRRTPFERGDPATPPSEGECRRDFRDGLRVGGEAPGARRGDHPDGQTGPRNPRRRRPQQHL